jgi:protein ImuA
MTAASSLHLASDLQLPGVWQVASFAREEQVLASGHAALDAQLPGGGWPVGGAVELLQARPEQHAWQLVLPALAQRVRAQPGPVVLVNPPFEPYGPGLSAQGLPLARLLKIRADKAAARLWATEQALRCADVAAVLAWLPQAKSAELRRLQLAAHQHEQLLFVMRPLTAARESSPARLRLQLEGTRVLRVQVLKRRGPPLMQPVLLPAHPPRLAALLEARRRKDAPAVSLPERSHVLDRAETVA